MFCKIIREYKTNCTTGSFSIFHEALLDPLFTCRSLERPWLNNQPQLSCIPDGVYPIFFTYSERLKFHCYEVLNVPGRSGIRIHPFNLAEESEGCIALGTSFTITDTYFLNSSRKTIQKMEVVLQSKPSKLIIASAAKMAA